MQWRFPMSLLRRRAVLLTLRDAALIALPGLPFAAYCAVMFSVICSQPPAVDRSAAVYRLLHGHVQRRSLG